MSSPVAGFFNSLIAQVSAGSEYAAIVTEQQKRHLLHGVFNAYYHAEQDKEIIFDTNRIWCSRMPALRDLFPDAKVIACARHVGWVMDSIEKQYRSNPFENTKLFGNFARSNVYQRLEGLAHHDQLVGFAWAALREAFYGEQAKSLLVVDYELLSSTPQKVMPLIYQFLGEPYFEHDFERVEYDAPDFDLQLGAPGLHRVRSKVEFQERRTILPPDLFDKFSQMNFWHDPSGSAANIIAPRAKLKEDAP